MHIYLLISLPQIGGSVTPLNTRFTQLITRRNYRLLRQNNGTSAIRCVGRDRPVGNPNVDQRLHRLRIPIREKAVEFGDRTKMDEARIEISPSLSIVLPAQVPERVNPMRMIEMRIYTENLSKACAAIMEECFREACSLANPIVAVGNDTFG